MFRKTSLSLFFTLFLASFALAQEAPVHWKFSTKKVSDCEYDLMFSATIDEGWHMYSLNKLSDDGPMPTVFKFNKSSDYELVGKVKQGTPVKEFDKVFETQVEYFHHTASFTQRVKLLAKKQITVTGKYEFQACTDEKCIFPPADEFSFSLTGTDACVSATGAVAPTATTTATASAETATTTAPADSVATKADTTKAATVASNTTQVSASTVDSDPDSASIEGKTWWVILLTGFGWGFAALFTPCVFPLIPMNVSFFLKRSKTKAKGKLNAVLYALSIIVIFVSLGLGISAIWGGGALNSFATSAGFNIVIFLLLLVFAASFLGAFEIVLPSKFVNKIDQQSDKGGFVGIFFMALALVVVSFSCTGPMIGNALVAASTSGNTSGAFWAMLGFSAGLALPFGLFAFFPSFLNSMPKSGGWLNTVKVVLGFLELALALKFASNVDIAYDWGLLTREVFISIWVVVFALMTIYLLGGFKTAHDSEVKHLSVSRIFFAIAAFFMTVYLIPGLWGAPLKLFSGVLPSYDYSESPNGFGGSTTAPMSMTKVDPEFMPYVHTSKTGIVHFKNDYDHALAYARKTGKPLMIDFTGEQCANCRKTEDFIWPDPRVTAILNNDVVLVSLFVDDKAPLDPKDYQKVFWYGKERTITDVGDKFKYLEESVYGQSTQPLYVMLDANEKPLNPVRGYKSDIDGYIKWLNQGLDEFKKRKATPAP